MKTFLKVFIILCVICASILKSKAQVSVSITVGTPPPLLRVYDLPEPPADGYIWQPGYWAYDNVDGYYWVPGVWVAPQVPACIGPRLIGGTRADGMAFMPAIGGQA